jgi:hypothetical protein
MHTQLHLMLVQQAQAGTQRSRPAERPSRASRRGIRGRGRARAAAPGLPPRAAPGT